MHGNQYCLLELYIIVGIHLQAAEFFRKGTEYIVTNGQVVLIDEATGRTKVKSRYDDGLHQALEAKEKVLEDIYGTVEEDHPVRINADNYTIASVTFQVSTLEICHIFILKQSVHNLY